MEDARAKDRVVKQLVRTFSQLALPTPSGDVSGLVCRFVICRQGVRPG